MIRRQLTILKQRAVIISGLLKGLLPILLLALACGNVKAQVNQVPGTPTTLMNAPQRDTTNKTNTSDWVDFKARIYYRSIYSTRQQKPDTNIHHFHRRPFTQPWYINTGNTGSPAKNLLFTTERRTGPTLGYHSFDVYRYNIDSLRYYNTNRAYSDFSYQLGSKAEQVVKILHTQNISPRWNFGVEYRKINSPGFYKAQRVSSDNANLTTNYTGKNQRYQLFGAITYNKEQNDENGGIVSDSFLTDAAFRDRKTVPVRFSNDGYSDHRSAVTTLQRDFSILLYHHYTLGKYDTLYSEDSSQYSVKLRPRFRITHRFLLSSEKYQYKDLRPDSLRYTDFFQKQFASGDSVFMAQKWFRLDNSFMLNGFMGKAEKQLSFSAGIGIRTDKFTTAYDIGGNSNSFLSNYLIASIGKEAATIKQWNYSADAKFFFTGDAAGNFVVNANIGKGISDKIGSLQIGFKQELNNAPYNYTIYQNQYTKVTNSFNKESVTTLYGIVSNEPLQLNLAVKNYLIANYFYLNELQQFAQSADAFNITQVSLNKVFRLGSFVLDNELAYQQKTGNAPVNIPALMGRHQLSFEKGIFKNALKIATGIDVRYHTNYQPSAYSPFFNRYYYQSTYSVSNTPEVALFFNFKIKNFRSYIMGDQLQQLFARNTIYAPGYAAPNAMIRFGFSWVLIN